MTSSRLTDAHSGLAEPQSPQTLLLGFSHRRSATWLQDRALRIVEDRLSNQIERSLDESTDRLQATMKPRKDQRGANKEKKGVRTYRLVFRQTDIQTNGCVPEGLVGSDEGKRVFSCGFHWGYIQRDREGGDAQLEAFLVGINPKVMTPNSSIGPAPWVLDSYLSMEFRGGGAWLASRSQQRCDPTIMNLWVMKTPRRGIMNYWQTGSWA